LLHLAFNELIFSTNTRQFAKSSCHGMRNIVFYLNPNNLYRQRAN